MRFTPKDYRAYLQISRKKHLLVEGRDDKRAFKLWFDELHLQSENSGFSEINIDSANDLIAFSITLGNREKVEHIAGSLTGTRYSERFVAFVDREFREFKVSESGLENLQTDPKVVDRLVWSKGHSIENYYFSFSVLRTPLRDFSVISEFDKALGLLSKVFVSAVRVACAASLTGLELNLLWLMKSTIDWKTILVKDVVVLKLDRWEDQLRRLRPGEEAAIIDRFKKWSEIVQDTDFGVILSLCHGHIGFSYLWATYASCVFEVTKDEAEAARVLRADESVRLNAVAGSWARSSTLGGHDCPVDVLRLLRLPLPRKPHSC